MAANTGKAWTPEEDEIIRQHYAELGKQTASLLENRTPTAVACRAARLGVATSKKDIMWSEEEDAVVRQYYLFDKQKVVELLPNRTKLAIATRANVLGVIPAREKDTYIFRGETFYTLRDVATKANVNYLTFQRYHKRTGDIEEAVAMARMTKPRSRTRFSDEEKEIVRQEYPAHGAKIQELLCRGYTEKQIGSVARKLNVSRAGQNIYFRGKVYDCLSDIAKEFGVSYAALRRRVNDDGQDLEEAVTELESRQEGDSFKFTKAEIEAIKEHYFLRGPNIPEVLNNHTKREISCKARSLGLHTATGYRLTGLGCNDIVCTAEGYIAGDGTQWIFAICGECYKVLLMPWEQAVSYRHGAGCSDYTVPEFVVLPNNIRYYKPR